MAGKDRDDETGISGKRKKTWRELDAQRGSKSKYSSRQDDAGQQRIERSASYEKYKKAADSLFSGGELPKGLAETFDPEGKRKAQKEAMQKVTEAPDRKAWVERVVAFPRRVPRDARGTRTSSTRCSTTRRTASSTRRWASSRRCSVMAGSSATRRPRACSSGCARSR
jgi:hypothetical protein